MRVPVIGVGIDTVAYGSASQQILSWARDGENRVVVAANVHVLMEAFDLPDFRLELAKADLVVPDGMPLVWFLRLSGHPAAERVYGPRLMLSVLAAAASANVPIGLYGSTAAVLGALARRLQNDIPSLRIVFSFAPPFRELTTVEDLQIVDEMCSSGARILFVGLGCPKQELWMAAHRGQIPAVLIGVGAAFDFLAGTRRQAPQWIGLLGLEWLFRLLHEPRRLWRRYLYHNPRFAVLAAAQWLGLWSP